MVYQEYPQCSTGGIGSIRSHIHRATLCLPKSLAGQERILLCLWIPDRRQHCEYRDRRRSHNCSDIHPALRGELQLVVAIDLHWWWQRLLGLLLLRLVLLHQAQYSRLCVGHAVLQLQLVGLFGLRVTDGDSGISDSICICEAYIWVSLRAGSFFEWVH